MAMGVADIPSETVKGLLMPFESKQQKSQASGSTMERKISLEGGELTSSSSRAQSQSTLGAEESVDLVQSPLIISDLSIQPSDDRQSSMSATLQGDLNSKRVDSCNDRVRSRAESGSRKDRDMMRQTGVHTSKGFGRIVKAVVQSPMELSVGITEGFHNAPKLWGDDTVRPQQRVSDFKSGAKAIGKEFAFGWYDGVSGIFTQPWKGAQREGAGGFFKGVGKGVGGFVTKPGAALFAIPSYFMKGVDKEVKKLFGGNVQNYIIASRAAQGYEEWLQSSDAEKQKVIDRWKLIQKYLKKKTNHDEILRDILEAQGKSNMKDDDTLQSRGNDGSSAHSTNSVDAITQDSENSRLALSNPEASFGVVNPGHEESTSTNEINEAIQLPAQEMPAEDAKEDSNTERATHEYLSQLRHQQREAADHQADQENLRQAIANSEAEAQRQACEVLEEEEQLTRAIEQSLREQREMSDDGQRASKMDLNYADAEVAKLKQSRAIPEKTEDKVAVIEGSSSGVHQPPSYDPGHLAGTTRSEFEAQQQGQRGEKTAREKMEEEIVLEYVKKQSLLEQRHYSQNKGKGRATDPANTTDPEDIDERDFQKVLKSSIEGSEKSVEYRY